jgi:centromere protein I
MKTNQIFSNNIQIQQSVFDFYDTLISYPTKHQIVHITMPSSSIVYYPFFSSSPASISRICGILTQYLYSCLTNWRFKIAFELYESASRERQDRGGLAMPAYSRDFVNYFNGFVMDLCNCLWRNRALNNADKNALGCQIPESFPLKFNKLTVEM